VEFITGRLDELVDSRSCCSSQLFQGWRLIEGLHASGRCFFGFVEVVERRAPNLVCSIRDVEGSDELYLIANRGQFGLKTRDHVGDPMSPLRNIILAIVDEPEKETA